VERDTPLAVGFPLPRMDVHSRRGALPEMLVSAMDCRRTMKRAISKLSVYFKANKMR